MGFTLLEILIASVIMAAITTFAAVGINTLLDCKKTENEKPKLAFEAFQLLNEIEKNLENKCTSLGNLLIHENAYPFQFSPSGPGHDFENSAYPSLSFFIHSPEGPRAICYGLAPLPALISKNSPAALGLFKFTLDTASSVTILENFSSEDDLYTPFPTENMGKLANLLSDSTVLFEMHLVKLAPDGMALDYLNTDARAIKMYAGKWTLEGAIKFEDVLFTEITLGLLPKSLHGQYFSSVDRKSFLKKNGFQLSRLLPWYI
ncbi:MAG: type II secretion system GspH family protein [Puniceicoccales bacterium]|nr:type II secretion system GspH family protein [Puniceicoccales bacterium]